MNISYSPVILCGMREICEKMGVGPTVVKRWLEHGAPIAVEGDASRTRYCAEASALMAWRLARTERK